MCVGDAAQELPCHGNAVHCSDQLPMVLQINKTIPHELPASGTLNFRCNICGGASAAPMAALGRETPSCPYCNSTVRMRGMIHALSVALFGQSLALPDFPERPEIVGKGMSDWDVYAALLAKKLSYTNTYYHQEPRLDITSISDADRSSVDFLISTDVFEHVAPPVSRAFDNAREMLRAQGAFIFSVPYTAAKETKEHFPNLHDFRIELRSGQQVLINRTRAGVVEEFSDLVFHGGGGDTLELRVFSETGLLDELARAGFGDVTIMSKPCFEHGIYWPIPRSLPIIARVSPDCIAVTDWGPVSSSIGSPANKQGGGRSAMWLSLERTLGGRRPRLLVGGVALDDLIVGDKIITGLIPDTVVNTKGRYPVTLSVPGMPTLFVGDFHVCD